LTKVIMYCIQRLPCSKLINTAVVLWYVKIIFFWFDCDIESVKPVIMFNFIFLIYAQDQIHVWFSAW